jgi:hypothetical protein
MPTTAIPKLMPTTTIPTTCVNCDDFWELYFTDWNFVIM